MDFNYTFEEKDSVGIINLSGSLMENNQVAGLIEEVENRVLQESNKFIVCMDNLKYMNSTGLNVLISILTKSRRSGGDVVICCVPKKVQELLLITKLNTVFTITDNLENALEVFKEN